MTTTAMVTTTTIVVGGGVEEGRKILPYYDLTVSTNKDVYYQRETAKITITVINRGHLPDKDAILTIFIDDSPVYREISQQADIGTTILNKTFYVGNMSSGNHTTKVEYNITHQVGSLTALTGFAVYPYQLLIPVPNLVVTILSVIVILLVLAGIRKIRKHV